MSGRPTWKDEAGSLEAFLWRVPEHRMASDRQSGRFLPAAEVAAYLRVPEAAILALVEQGDLPARQIGGEWRFLKRAEAEWLHRGTIPPARGSTQAVLRHFGAFRDDDDLDEQLAALRKRREAEISA